ncbi:DEAD/DEAH box helicase family protein [Bacillus firmus]|uniref:DEAD/DEAH box helicase n=1 Tax=Cytobacillus TaxID=2675230 RepID=UPI0011A74309|nr:MULTISPECIES: DEAD/DEAH box helicase family protein [Cytobacillus]MBZ9534535.1 DEAD/DEAH box helicase family protein [Cytobacillus oceanisediminis]NUH82916.1 DEAD/DEAH box helicase family protein [Cytobacillus firmus]
MSYFMDIVPNIETNKELREPQIEAYIKVREYFNENPNGEALVVLPTGTGKSGLIAIAPFGVSNSRVLVITPGLVTKQSVVKTLHPMEENFWLNRNIIFDPMDMPVVEEYESDMLESSLKKCNFVIANVHKLYQERENSLLNRVPHDFFDMIIIDEAHHSVADTWKNALDYFSKAKKLHVTGTPYRGDNKELPGEEIHNTPLSEVMALKYVKWLRKKTVNNPNIYFTVPGESERFTKEQVLQLKEREWLEKSVALSKECSLDVIAESINQLNDIKKYSPTVPHKILAVASSINHAQDLVKWYEENGKRVIVVHSKMNPDELEKAFIRIENHECDVVVSVNMLMEGYDHKYLTVLALFRPYRSLNAFAQVVGRVLRAIPDEEINNFAIDNNAVVIYHEEIGLNTMWEFFSKEVEKSKKIPVREYTISDREYVKREIVYAGIEKDDYFISDQDSYLDTVDFNELFKAARDEVDKNVDEKIDALRNSGLLNEEELEATKETLRNKALQQKKGEIDDILLSKRPELLRKKSRSYLYNNANEAAIAILEEHGIDPKENTLYDKFKNLIFSLKPETPNDGILVRYINTRLNKKYGPVKKREPEQLLASQKYLEDVVKEIRRML